MRLRQRLLPALVTGALLCAVAGTTPALADDRSEPAPGHGVSDPRADRQGLPQTSDGVRGATARQVPTSLRGWSERSSERSFQVAPGVQFQRWDLTDARGPNRFYLLTINPRKPGLKIDYTGPTDVAETSPVLQQLKPDRAIAGFNGDFFDIGDTGAPLGIGKDRQRGVLHGPVDGWNSAFYLDKSGRPGIGTIPMRAKWEQHPNLAITNLNSPSVRPGGIGLYTRAWGRTSGYRVTDHQNTDVRMVVVRNGRVVQNKPSLSKNKVIDGAVLIGRDAGAAALAKIRVGTKADLRYWLEGNPQVAITGNKFLLLDGVSQVVDDREMHPRTAIGVDDETGKILVLVVDGRQSFSRGYTMVELARLMSSLGADSALNLDGGGSSTLVGRKPSGRIRVLNSPSDGVQRYVANGLEVTYDRGRK